MADTLRVLIVDDSADDRFILVRGLAKTGCAVEINEVEDGGEAVDFFSRQGRYREVARPHVVFLDLKMPGLDGFDVLRWLRQNPVEPPIQVVVLSGSELETDKRLARELGASVYLTKPATADRLRELLSGELRLSVPGGSLL